ncbi:MAG: hypothetical protein KKF27_21900 [Gammaproteobacteria bacterium]|nr:hypothetical protein [Gammaproteobacteria bacterium]MBU2685905.1 hypothetical protein [Gammaproteobacteria bacterium]
MNDELSALNERIVKIQELIYRAMLENKRYVQMAKGTDHRLVKEAVLRKEGESAAFQAVSDALAGDLALLTVCATGFIGPLTSSHGKVKFW